MEKIYDIIFSPEIAQHSDSETELFTIKELESFIEDCKKAGITHLSLYSYSSCSAYGHPSVEAISIECYK